MKEIYREVYGDTNKSDFIYGGIVSNSEQYKDKVLNMARELTKKLEEIRRRILEKGLTCGCSEVKADVRIRNNIIWVEFDNWIESAELYEEEWLNVKMTIREYRLKYVEENEQPDEIIRVVFDYTIVPNLEACGYRIGDCGYLNPIEEFERKLSSIMEKVFEIEITPRNFETMEIKDYRILDVIDIEILRKILSKYSLESPR